MVQKKKLDSEIGLDPVIRSWFRSRSYLQYVLFKTFLQDWDNFDPKNPDYPDPSERVDSRKLSGTKYNKTLKLVK